jgi:hypothetical protein
MTASLLVALALVAPAQPPAKPPAKQPAKPPAEAWFGIPANSTYHWPAHVLTSADVQKELKLTRAQLAKLPPIRAELDRRVQRSGTLPPAKLEPYFVEAGKWADKAVAGVLTEEQRPRHRQITWQVLEFLGGPVGMATNPVFAREIGLSADQVKRAEKVQAEYQAAWQRLVQANPLAGNAPIPGADQLQAKADEAVLKLLTDDQKKKWNEVLGEPFKGDIHLLPGMPPFKAPGPKK